MAFVGIIVLEQIEYAVGDRFESLIEERSTSPGPGGLSRGLRGVSFASSSAAKTSTRLGIDNPISSGPFDRVVIQVVKGDLLSRFDGVRLDDDAGVSAGVA